MKAEERHELETNTLAATLTKAVSTAKGTETSQWIYATVIVLVVFLVGFLVMRYFATRAAEAALSCVELYDGSGKILQRLAKDAPTSVPGKVARLQSAWVRFWDFGLKKIMADPNGAKVQLEELASQYEELKNDCKGDPIFEPEALYALAVIEETRTLYDKDRKRLDSALDMYKDVVSKHPKSAQAAMAQPWIEKLENTQNRKQIERFYDELQLNQPGLPRIPIPANPVFEPTKK